MTTPRRRTPLSLSFSVAALVVTSSGLLAFAPHKGTAPAKKPSLSEKIRNWGVFNREAKSHVHALDAWNLSLGSKSVVVAVIDTGLDASHRDLKVNVWKDPSAKAETYGWNFVNDRPNPGDEHGHGTHVAGIIGAQSNPETGVSGVAPKVSIMAVKYYSDRNSGAVNLRNTVKAINYAVDHGAKIINYSGGGPEFSEDEYIALKRAEARGVLVVAAAGNEHQNTDLPENYYYPAAYRLTNMISVAATDIRNNLLPSSNWGASKVDVAAPGENIYSTLPNGRYGYMTGTSQATAFVSGIAALLLSKNPNLKPSEVRSLIISSADAIPSLRGRVLAQGRVNAFAALLALRSPTAPRGAPIFATQPVRAEGARRPVSLLESLAEPQALLAE